VFGDLFLADLRAYREAQLAALGLAPVFPLWRREEAPALLRRTYLRRASPRRSAAGIDPCGENGEFHTFASAGPMFAHPIEVEPGETVARDEFFFADLLPKGPQRSG
jgi:diphthamide synthase (EF-2-diphthine--ammonia ligase)